MITCARGVLISTRAIVASMPVFVTGATGFIGSHPVEALVRNNEQVYAPVRKTSNTGRLKRLGSTLIDGDVTDASSTHSQSATYLFAH